MRKNTLSKLRVATTVAMSVVMLAGCGKKADNKVETTPIPGTGEEVTDSNVKVNFEKKKVAFATNAVDETFAQMKKAYEEMIGPALNIEFMFSEMLSDAGAFTTFAENAYAAGCDGVISNLAQSNEQAAAICNDLGLFYVGISSGDAKENTEMSYFVSTTGASAEGYATSYAQALQSVLSAEEPKSVLILSGAACYGATSFIEGTAGSLEALKDIYGLTYEKDIRELTTTDVQLDVANDKGIKITIFPGMADMATNVSPLLQSGEYDVVVGTTNIFDSLAVAIDEVEKALNKNIIFISRNGFSQAIGEAFNGTDSQGNPILDAIVSQGTYDNVAAALVMRNALDGFSDNMRDNGKASRIPGMEPLAVVNKEEYNTLSAEDMPYSFVTEEDLLNLCNKVNPNVTFGDINDFGAALNTQSILEKFAK